MSNSFLALAQNNLEQRTNARWIPREKRPQYHNQLLHEVDFVLSRQLESHFLAAMDLVQHLKEHGFIVGPNGGSANASLLAYALGIHDVDSIRHGLIFESFFRYSINPIFAVHLCNDGHVAARNYLCKRYGRKHIAWEDYTELSALVITKHPAKHDLNITGKRPDYPVATLSREREEVYGFMVRLIPVPLLGRISRTSRNIVDEWDDDTAVLAFEEFRKAPDVENKGEGEEMVPGWVPATRYSRIDGYSVVDCLKKLGPPNNFDEFILAYHLATIPDQVERENLIEECLRARRSPWDAGGIIEDETVKEILASTCGVVIYAEQVVRLLAYYGGLSIDDSIKLFKNIQRLGSSSPEELRADFLHQASLQEDEEALIHDEDLISKVFDFLIDRFRKHHFMYKAWLVGETLLANGASQIYIFFSALRND